jgi:predicted amidophosphoribosyltransferase
MRSIGLPELLVIFFVLLVPFALIAFIVWWVVNRKRNATGSKSCVHCGQRIPDIGVFCPVCGQKSAAP